MSTTSADPLGLGWRRSDGRVGLRNHVVALSTVALTNRLAQLAVERTPGTLAVAGDFLRGLRAADARRQAALVEAIVHHPNVGGLLFLTHDVTAARACADLFADAGKPVACFALMAQRGFGAAVEAAAAALARVVAAAGQAERAPLALGDLVLALECGGSDASSAVCANPAIGRFVDRVAAAGGVAIVSETAEFIGAEPVVRARAASPAAAEAILSDIARCEDMMAADGEDYRGVNPTPENLEAGLTTLVEKSMGAVCKIGTQPLVGRLGWGERPTGGGVWFMDTPFFSPVSITGMVAAGAQLTLFAMGVFNPSGNPLAPTVKVSGNPRTVVDWADCIDVDVSGLIDGTLDLDAAADRIRAAVSSAAAGVPTRTEAWGEGQIIAPKTMPAL